MKALALLVLGIALVDGLNPVHDRSGARARRQAARRRCSSRSSPSGCSSPRWLPACSWSSGPGQALIDLIPHLGPLAKHLLEIGAGVALAGVAWILWIHRRRVAGGMSREPPGGALGAAGLGAGIILAELPTAFPYFAALAAIVRSSATLAGQLELVALFNVAFVLPLLVIVGVRAVAGPRSEAVLERLRGAMERYAGVLLPCAVGLIAAVLLILGILGIVRG